MMPMSTVAARSILPARDVPSAPRTLVLDANLRLIERTPWQRAVTMQLAGSVTPLVPYQVLNEDGVLVDALVRSPSMTLPMPYIVSLVGFVVDPYAAFITAKSERVSTRAILERDGYLCSYCNERASTKDHIIPKSKGGPSTWTNLAAACFDCNQRKADRTPAEAGMPLLREPANYDGFSVDLQQEIYDFLMEVVGAK